MRNKPKKGEVYWLDLEEEDKKLKSPPSHPCIVTGNNIDDTTSVVGCTSKNKPWLGDVKVETEPEMSIPTYARVYDKERDIDNSSFNNGTRDKLGRVCTNLEEIEKKL